MAAVKMQDAKPALRLIRTARTHPTTAMEITAEDADYAENAEKRGLRWQAMRSASFTHWVGRG